MTVETMHQDGIAAQLRHSVEPARWKPGQTPEDLADLSLEEARHMLHELRAYQIELEAQNEKLRAREYFHRQVLESIPGLVFTALPDGYCDYQNQQCIDYAGVPMEDHLGDKWHLLLHPDDRSRTMAAWRAAVEGRASCYDLEYRMRRHDGIYEWFRVSARPIRDKSGRIVRWFGLLMNIDELKRTTEYLSRQEILLRTITDNVEDGIFVLDRAHRFVFLNTSYLGYIRQSLHRSDLQMTDMIGRTIRDFLGNNTLSRTLMRSDELVMSTGVSDVSEDSFTTPYGEHFQLISRAPYCDASDQVIGLVGIARDITKFKQAEMEHVAALERQRDVLVREVHHRIKNHLQGVTGLLRNAIADTPEVCVPLEAAIGRINSVAQVYGLQSCRDDVRMLVSDLIVSAIEIASGPVAVVFDCPAGNREAILLPEDAVPVALIINELITNALKHLLSPDPLRPVRVDLKVEEKGFCVLISCGPASLPPGFDFDKGQGLGTGLELAKALLPSRGARLAFRQRQDEVIAELCLAVSRRD